MKWVHTCLRPFFASLKGHWCEGISIGPWYLPIVWGELDFIPTSSLLWLNHNSNSKKNNSEMKANNQIKVYSTPSQVSKEIQPIVICTPPTNQTMEASIWTIPFVVSSPIEFKETKNPCTTRIWEIICMATWLIFCRPKSLCSGKIAWLWKIERNCVSCKSQFKSSLNFTTGATQS